MRTLCELGEFVGLPQDSGEFGPPIPPLGLRLVSTLLAPVSTAQQRSSMRAMIGLVQAKSFGAVIGKALQPLKAGKGLIPILIALQ
jgi:hypothetical protein